MWTPESEQPAWRYTVVSGELERERRGLPVFEPCRDPAAQHLKEFLRTVRTGRIDTMHRSKVFGPLATTLAWFRDTRPNGMKDSIEAMILAKADLPFVREHVNQDVDYHTMNMYRLFFFDVAKHMDSQMWIDRNVFMPESNHEPRRRVSAYLWKIIAYHGGRIKLLQASVAGRAMDLETMEWIKTFCVNTKVKDISLAVTSLTKMPAVVKMPYVAQTAQPWESASNEAGKQLPSAQEGSAKDIMTARDLGRSLKSNKKEDTLSIEETCDIDKFNDGDFKND